MKSWITAKTLDNERYHIPTIKDFGTSATEVTTKANAPIRKSHFQQDISFTKRGERGDKISQQKLQQEANEPIWNSPIRQDISFTKRGEKRDKISEQDFQPRK